jgi:hypothetical protein
MFVINIQQEIDARTECAGMVRDLCVLCSGDDSIEKPRMRYFCGNPIVCHRREADCSDADGRHLSRAFRF